MLLNISQNDIDTAIPCSTTDCVVAKALKRQLNYEEIHVTMFSIYYRKSNKEREFSQAIMPGNLMQLVQDFDRGIIVQPTTFEVDLP